MKKSNIYIIGSCLKYVDFTTFSDGSETCTLPENISGDLMVRVNIEDVNRDLIRIGLVKDALGRLPEIGKVRLALPYMPQARADKKFGVGMPLPLKIFADILNSFKFDSVVVEDPHSDVTSALINNVKVLSQYEVFIGHHLSDIADDFMRTDYVLVSPDIGASKKVFDVAKALDKDTFVQALKIRDVLTGNIVKCEVQCEDLKGRNVLIIDDISDGGASFLHLARLLKEKHNAGLVMLYVTHGIFAKGLEPFKGVIDVIEVHNIIGDFITTEDLTTFNYQSRINQKQ